MNKDLLFRWLEDKREFSISTLKALITDYSNQNTAITLQQSGILFDSIRSYLIVDDNYIYPGITNVVICQEDLIILREIHIDISDLLDRAVMIHIDEPHQEFLVDLIKLQELLKREYIYTLSGSYPAAKTLLTEADVAEVTKNYHNDELIHQQ